MDRRQARQQPPPSHYRHRVPRRGHYFPQGQTVPRAEVRRDLGQRPDLVAGARLQAAAGVARPVLPHRLPHLAKTNLTPARDRTGRSPARHLPEREQEQAPVRPQVPKLEQVPEPEPVPEQLRVQVPEQLCLASAQAPPQSRSAWGQWPLSRPRWRLCWRHSGSPSSSRLQRAP